MNKKYLKNSLQMTNQELLAYFVFAIPFLIGCVIGFCTKYNYKEAKRINKEWEEYYKNKS